MSDTPSSRTKVTLLATSIFIPVMLWFICGFLLSYQTLENDLITSIVIGMTCSLLVYLIERQILLGGKSKGAVILRIILGFLIATLGAICIDEVIFAKEIDYQLSQNRVSSVNEVLIEYKAQNSVELDKLKVAMDEKYNNWQAALNQAIQEADGTGGSKQRGFSAITRLKLTTAEENKKEYENANRKYKEELNKLDSKTEILKLKLNESYSDKSLLLRIKAMYDLVLSDPFMLSIYIIFSLILLILEFSVIIAKFGIAQTNYERKVELIEKIGEKRINELAEMDSIVFNQDNLYYNNSQSRNKYPTYLNG